MASMCNALGGPSPREGGGRIGRGLGTFGRRRRRTRRLVLRLNLIWGRRLRLAAMAAICTSAIITWASRTALRERPLASRRLSGGCRPSTGQGGMFRCRIACMI